MDYESPEVTTNNKGFEITTNESTKIATVTENSEITAENPEITTTDRKHKRSKSE